MGYKGIFKGLNLIHRKDIFVFIFKHYNCLCHNIYDMFFMFYYILFYCMIAFCLMLLKLQIQKKINCEINDQNEVSINPSPIIITVGAQS